VALTFAEPVNVMRIPVVKRDPRCFV
jgi:hypothetical protein